MQVNARIFVASVKTVFKVALNRAANCRKLTTDLVMPAGFQVDPKYKIIVQFLDELVMQNGFFYYREPL